jgi:hypothetical protein
MEYREPYIYAVCLEAGVCVLETVSTGVAGPAPCGARSQTFDVWPTVAAGLVLVRTDNVAGPVRLTLFDAAGQRMKVVRSKRAVGSTTTSLPMADLLPGVYVVRAEWAGFAGSQKVVKLPGR